MLYKLINRRGHFLIPYINFFYTFMNSLSKETKVMVVISNFPDTSSEYHLSLFSYFATSLNCTVFIFFVPFSTPQSPGKSGINNIDYILFELCCLSFIIFVSFSFVCSCSFFSFGE